MSPRDPRFLSISRAEIIQDFLAQQEWDKLEAEAKEKVEEESLPWCPECEYRGMPGPPTWEHCPRCGTKMQTGNVFVDPGFDEELKRLGINREDIQ